MCDKSALTIGEGSTCIKFCEHPYKLFYVVGINFKHFGQKFEICLKPYRIKHMHTVDTHKVSAYF